MNKISNNRIGLSLLALSALPVAFAGCARGVIGSEVQASGAWTRTVVLHAPATDKTNGLKPPAKIEDVFAIPGAPWTVTKEKKDEELLITAKRTMKLGESLSRDVVCKSTVNAKSIEVMVNECSVKETSPGVYTYREVLHWVGPKPKPMVDMEAAKQLKALLPPALATDASMHRLADSITQDFMMVLLGPPDPLITHLMSQVMMNPDLAMHKLSARLGDSLEKALAAEYGDKMSPQQRRDVVKKLVESALKSTTDKANPSAGLDPSKAGANDNGSGVALTFTVKLPGRVMTTNGEIDKLTNEVYWGLYPEAASLGQDIVLTASCQANEKITQR